MCDAPVSLLEQAAVALDRLLKIEEAAEAVVLDIMAGEPFDADARELQKALGIEDCPV